MVVYTVIKPRELFHAFKCLWPEQNVIRKLDLLQTLLLLLLSQLYLWGSPFLGEIFAYVTCFNPTIESIIFCLHGWCMLGVYFVSFTYLGHKCPDLLSLCDGMHV